MSASTRTKTIFRQGVTIVLALALLVGLWEGYKAMGTATGGVWPGTSTELLVAPNDLIMPPVGDIWDALWKPVQRGKEQVLAVFLLKSAGFTLLEATVGFAIGVSVGLLLAVLMLRFKVAERGILPWINISQTIPLIALAPIVVTWGASTFLTKPQAVSLIASYLTFFPVAVNGLRGLQSPSKADVDLMRSLAASWRDTLFKLRFPAARAYLFPAFKLAATLSVVGAIVGEISSGVGGGLGRVILDFASRYSTGPPKLYAAVLAAAMLGLTVFGLVTLIERLILHGRTQPALTSIGAQ